MSDEVPELHRKMARDGFAQRSRARAGGLPSSRFTAEARRSGWEKTSSRGVWVPSLHTTDHVTLVRAHLEAIGPPVLVTGASALFMRGVLDDEPPEVELLVPLARSPAKRAGVRVRHTRSFDDVRYQTVAGLPVVAVPRALADFAGSASFKALCYAISTALRLRRCTLPLLWAEVEQRRRFAGRGTLRQALTAFEAETTHSAGERLARRLLRDAGLRPAPKPLLVPTSSGINAEIDIAFEDVRYGLEVDGPHHLLPDVAAADRARDRALLRDGWTLDRFLWFEIEERGAWFARQVVRQLEALRETTR